MKRFLSLAMMFVLASAYALAAPAQATLQEVRATHQRPVRHHAHKAGKHHRPRRAHHHAV